MFTLVRQGSLRQLLFQQAPTLTVALVIAEIFYKFHSFTLECLAFLWFILDLAGSYVARLVNMRPATGAHQGRRSS